MLQPATIKSTTKQGNVILNAKIVRGVAHPPGEPDTYNGLKLTQREIFEKYESLPGTMVYDNHDLSRPVGKVVAVSIGDDGELLMDAMISRDYPYSEEVIQRVLSGDYRGMSLGMDHKVNMETGYVHESNIHELSLCPEGDLPGTLIRTIASKDRGLENPFQTKWFDLDTGASAISAFEMNRTIEAASKAFDWIGDFKPNINNVGGSAGTGAGGNSLTTSPALYQYKSNGIFSTPNSTTSSTVDKTATGTGGHNAGATVMDSDPGDDLSFTSSSSSSSSPISHVSESFNGHKSSMGDSQQASSSSLSTSNIAPPAGSPGKSLFSNNNNNNNNNQKNIKESEFGDDRLPHGGEEVSDPKNKIRPPTKEDPYYRNALGQFSKDPNKQTENHSFSVEGDYHHRYNDNHDNENENNNNNEHGDNLTKTFEVGESHQSISHFSIPTQKNTNYQPQSQPQPPYSLQLGQSAASIIAEAVRGQGLMPSSNGVIGGGQLQQQQQQQQASQSLNTNGGNHTGQMPYQANTNSSGISSTPHQTAPTGQTLGGNASNGNRGDGVASNGDSMSAGSNDNNAAQNKGGDNGTTSSSSSSNNKKVSIPQQEYSQFLDIKSQHEALLKEKEEMEKKQKEMAQKLKEWENIGSTIGGSMDLEASRRVVEDLKKKEINRFLDKLNEIMPELDQVYKEAEGSEKKSIEPVIKTLKNYQLNCDQLQDPGQLEGAKGLVEIVTKASRNYNTRFTEKEAEIKELQRKYAEKQRELEEAKKREAELSQKAALYSNSASNLSGGKSIEPTFIGSERDQQFSQNNNNNNSYGNNNHHHSHNTDHSSGGQTSRIHTTASSGKRKGGAMSGSYYSSSNPLDCPPGFESGYTFREHIQRTGRGGASSGGLQTISTTASSSSGSGWGGMTPQEFERQRQLATKSVSVPHDEYGDVNIEFRPWNPKTQGIFSQYGPDYIGNRTFDWIERCIKENSLSDVPVVMRAIESDQLMSVDDAISKGSLKRPRWW